MKSIAGIAPHFEPNKLLAVNKSNAQHNEVRTRLTVAKRSNALHLNQMNIDVVMPDVSSITWIDLYWIICLTIFELLQVFKLTNLVRLDLSFNNIVKLSPQIQQLQNLQQLWLNDNPLREVPLELSYCQKLKVRHPFHLMFYSSIKPFAGTGFEKHLHNYRAKGAGKSGPPPHPQPGWLPAQRELEHFLLQRHDSNPHGPEEEGRPQDL